MKHVAIYLTNTDKSDFAANHDTDAVKVIKRLAGVGAAYDYAVFNVTAGEFPADPVGFDAVIITGSPAFVDDPHGWIATLLDHIRKIVAAKTPLVGLCFGHQAVIAAMGGKVGRKDTWIFGGAEFDVIEQRPWMDPPSDRLKLYAANTAQVTRLPEGFDLLGGSTACPIALTALGDHVFTTQFHPEMSDTFIHDLVEEYVDEIGDGIAEARASIIDPAQGPLFGLWMRRFIEMPRG